MNGSLFVNRYSILAQLLVSNTVAAFLNPFFLGNQPVIKTNPKKSLKQYSLFLFLIFDISAIFFYRFIRSIFIHPLIDKL
jgi:hypothetical protein